MPLRCLLALVAGVASAWRSHPPTRLVAAVRGGGVLRPHRRPAGPAGPGSRAWSSASPSRSRCCSGCTWSAPSRGWGWPSRRPPGTACSRWPWCRCGGSRWRPPGSRCRGWRWRASAVPGRPAGCPGEVSPTRSMDTRSRPRCPTPARPASASWSRSGRPARGPRGRPAADPACAPWPPGRAGRGRPSCRSAAPYDASSAGRWTVAAVQGNVPGDGTHVLAHYRQITAQHTAETERLADDVRAGRAQEPDLVVWPENSTAIDPFYDAAMSTDIQEAVRAIGVPLLAGVVVDGGPKHVLNQGIVFDLVTGAGDRYTKWHPVPFGEYIPWRWLFGTHLAAAQPDPARHGARHPGRAARRTRGPGRRRDLLRRRLRRRHLRPAPARRPGAGGADQQRDVHPHRADRPAVRDQPAPRPRDPSLRRGGCDQRADRCDRPGRLGGHHHPAAHPVLRRGHRRALRRGHAGGTDRAVARAAVPRSRGPRLGLALGRYRRTRSTSEQPAASAPLTDRTPA